MFSLSGSSLRKNLARILLSVFVCNIFSPLQFAFAAVTWNVVYSTTAPTNQNVVATLNTSEPVTFDFDTSSSYSFSENGSTTLYFHDADNNDYSVDIEVTNIDKVAPVVTLIGSGTMTISQGQSFVDPGATWSDTKIVKFGSGTRESSTGNGIITTPTTGSVDTNTPGTYTLTYNKTDDAGNPGAAVTRTVTITPAPDTTPPVLTLVGNESITVLKGSTYTDSGALWTDNVDGTGVVISVDTVDTNIVGVYTLG